VRFGQKVALLFIKCVTPVFRYHSADLLDPALAGHAECKSGRKQRLSLSLYGCESSEVSLAQEKDCLGCAQFADRFAREPCWNIFRGEEPKEKGRNPPTACAFFSLSFSRSLSLDAKTWAKWFFRNLSDCDVSTSHLPRVEHRLKKYTY